MPTGPPSKSVPVLQRTYCHLACEHQKVCEDKEVIIRYMKQEFTIVDHLYKRLPKDFKQLSRRRSMKISGISYT